MHTVLIVDDHAMLRNGVVRSLEEAGLDIVCDQASNGAEALDKATSRSYDLVFLDISLPGMSGLEVLKQLKSKQPLLPVIMLSMYAEERYAIGALRLGASGYLTKENAYEEIEVAVQKVLSGGRYISPSLGEALAKGLRTGLNKPALAYDVLSHREAQFLRLLVSGMTPSQIASQLSLSVKTISTYRSRVLTKLQLSNNMELIKFALKHGLTS